MSVKITLVPDCVFVPSWCACSLISSVRTSQCLESSCWMCFYPRLTKLVRGLWNGLRTCVCVCVSVRASVCACVRAQNVEICFFSVISWPILILFVYLIGAWCGLQNFYTEFWNSLIMQIYANLFKINDATCLSFLGRFWICLFYLIGLGAGFKTSTHSFEMH